MSGLLVGAQEAQSDREVDWMGKIVVLRIRHEFDAPAIAAMTAGSPASRRARKAR